MQMHFQCQSLSGSNACTILAIPAFLSQLSRGFRLAIGNTPSHSREGNGPDLVFKS